MNNINISNGEIRSDVFDTHVERTSPEHTDMRDRLVNAILGMCGETGEVSDILKKHIYQGHKLDIDKVREELGDVLWYVTLAAHAVGYTLGDVMRNNINKLNKRYPNGFEAERSVNRDKYENCDLNDDLKIFTNQEVADLLDLPDEVIRPISKKIDKTDE